MCFSSYCFQVPCVPGWRAGTVAAADGSYHSLDSESARVIAIKDLPGLQARGQDYYSQPFCGICVVGVLIALFVSCTRSAVADSAGGYDWTLPNACVVAVFAEAGIAVFMVLYILFAGAGEIRRSPGTCYPIPPEVDQRLRRGESLQDMENVQANTERADHAGMPDGTYCVRCLVWRPNVGRKAHHCRTCGRCVVGFDHHCDVFGRCIVQGNMLCFNGLISMMVAGIVTTMLAVIASAPGVE
ncbi:unnamed protein product [Prorocentrum cordatum]|uniref:Palmitoyltransferase n=1 Tax=Prorocentrum cordatum TaxID=2364126 RepID=A0ABN9QTV6_9DINO|nr:unnamed protein product [Polarella glacialis]|mmetsp:Transcript_17739/g.47395  ORF Transcript_17739/g.47395 Transcript_17739/m.47395 type:complete len:242 (+) Transcript_17739:106-831(+)